MQFPDKWDNENKEKDIVGVCLCISAISEIISFFFAKVFSL